MTRISTLGLVLAVATVPVAGLGTSSASAAIRYWDPTNGSALGTGSATPTGVNFDNTTLAWNDTADGTGTIVALATTDIATFSAGSDATGVFTVAVPANVTAGGLVIEEGEITMGSAAAVVLGAGNVTVNSGATLVTNSSARISTTAGSVYTLNGGTLRTTNASSAGSFIDVDSKITLGAAGGTIDYSVANVLNIIQTTSVISGTGGLTKTGVGVIALAAPSTYAGATLVNGGELRLRGTSNNLPITTDLTVSGTGIFNMNGGGLSQTVASLSGDGLIGTSGSTLTVTGSTSTTFSGALKNQANAGASGAAAANGRLVKGGSSVLTLSGLNDIGGSVTLSGTGGLTVTATGALCGPAADVTVNGGTLTLNNAAQTIENLAGTGGSIVLGTGHVLTSNPIASTSYAGTITGAGGLTRSNTSATQRILTLTGDNTFSGPLVINAGGVKPASTTGQGLRNVVSIALNAVSSSSATVSTVILGVSNQINDAATVSLNGGVFSSGGFSEGSFDGSNIGIAGVGVATLASSSIVDMGTSAASVLAFADSSAATWTGTLSVYNWNGGNNLGGGTDRLYFGSNEFGLTPAQLGQIKFYNDAGVSLLGEARILPTGEVVAVPEPVSLTALGLGLAGLVARRRRA